MGQNSILACDWSVEAFTGLLLADTNNFFNSHKGWKWGLDRGQLFLHLSYVFKWRTIINTISFYSSNIDSIINIFQDEFVMGCMQDEVLVKRLSANTDK